MVTTTIKREYIKLGLIFFLKKKGHQGRNKGPNTSLDLEVTLEELYNGADIELDISKQVICDHCFGSGAHTSESIRTCHTCQGQGTIVKRVQLAPGFVQQFQQHCDVCGGKGKVIKEHCHVCKGNKVKRGNEQYTVNIEKGMTSGQQVVSLSSLLEIISSQ
jgi:DnaJ-related protein SCJ1